MVMTFKKRLTKLYANVSAATRGRNKHERNLIRRQIMMAARGEDLVEVPSDENDIFKMVQQCCFPAEVLKSKRLLVMVVPEHNAMSGGIYSFFSIVEQLRRHKRHHGYDVLTVTRPNGMDLTYFRNTNFRNSENVFRFAQLLQCAEVEDLYLLVPEYEAAYLHLEMSDAEKAYMSGRKVHINLLNQNILLMPEPEKFAPLHQIADQVTQSVAHHSYFTQAVADKFGLPTLLLPAYTDLTPFPKCEFEDKEKLIIYSLDEAAHKVDCLRRLAAEFPDFKLVEIRDMKFDRYMELASSCMFSITFGEGFDGYLAQPILQGGVGFAIYNEEFFPGEHFKEYKNIFASADDMLARICTVMRALMNDPSAYKALNQRFSAEYDKLYSFDDYVARVKMLANKQFEIFPGAVK